MSTPRGTTSRWTMIMTTMAPALFCLAALPAGRPGAAQSLPDVGGVWTLDVAASTLLGGGRGDASGNATGGGGGRGGGTGLGPAAEVIAIEQTDTILVMTLQRNSASDTIRYRLDGKAVRNQMPVGGRGDRAEATYTSRVVRSRVETTIARKVGNRSIRYRELLYLNPDGALVLETDVVGAVGGRKAVYRKAR